MTTQSSLSFSSMGQKIGASRLLGKIASRIYGRLWKLPPAQTHNIAIERDIKVRMPDGVELLTDHYYPRGAGKLPTIVCRSPYGKGLMFSLQNVWAYVERGYQVVMQCCRGTYGSGGHMRQLHQEREDGLATIAWIKNNLGSTVSLPPSGKVTLVTRSGRSPARPVQSSKPWPSRSPPAPLTRCFIWGNHWRSKTTSAGRA